ncbi:MAG: hypothetical protein WCF30_17570 [Terracidiphilus sp.]
MYGGAADEAALPENNGPFWGARMPFHWLYNVAVYFVILSVVAIGFWAFRSVKRQRRSLRIPLRILSVAVISLGSLAFCLLLFIGLIAISRTTMVYSPDRRHAVQITDFDEGAVGGDTVVDLYSYWGLKKESVLSGTWKIVERKDLRWVGNNELLITYDGRFGQMPECNNAKAVVVNCVPAALSPNAQEQAPALAQPR